MDGGRQVEVSVERPGGRSRANIGREYRELRAQGLLVREAVETLAARHHCSEETMRTIIYGKRERQTRSHRG